MRDVETVPGVGAKLAKQLRDAFITTAELLAVQNPAELQAKTGITEGRVRNIIASAREVTKQGIFKSGIEVENEEALIPKLLTGVPKVDEKLLGGIPESSIIEFYGPARSGKTQWCHHLAVRAQLPLEDGGLAGRVLWMDTESSFKTWIIRANAIRWGLDPALALGNIQHARFVQSWLIEEAFEKLPELVIEHGIKLVVIDSLSALFRAEFKDLNNLRIRQQKMNSLLNTMRRIGVATGIIFAYTNQVMDQITQTGGYSNQPIGGHILSHGSDFRFYTAVGKDTDRVLKLRDNAGVPQFMTTVKFGWGGFYESAEEYKEDEARVVETLKQQDRYGFAKAAREILQEAAPVEE